VVAVAPEEEVVEGIFANKPPCTLEEDATMMNWLVSNNNSIIINMTGPGPTAAIVE